MKPAIHLTFVLASSCGIAIADDAAVLACRAVTVPAQRLACYDAITVAPAALAQSREKPVTAANAATAAAATTAAVPAAAAVPAVAATPAFKDRRFAAEPPPPDAESNIPGPFYGWWPREKIKLANGQVWQIVDNSSGAMNAVSPKVKLRRGLFGAFYLDIEGTTRSPKVERLE